jgi:hypothetical protein
MRPGIPSGRPAVPRWDKPQLEKLAGSGVFEVGDEAEKAALVVGKTGDGKWAGLKTTVVET